MKYMTIRPGTAVSSLLLDMFMPGAAPAVRPATKKRALQRALHRGLIRLQPDPRLTRTGRLYCIALRLRLTMSELAALSGIYAQTVSWNEEPRLAHSAAAPFAVRDHAILAPGAYRTASVRDMYNRLVMKGYIKYAGRGIVTLPCMERLKPYHDDLLYMRHHILGGRP